jgi:hypothetical protein
MYAELRNIGPTKVKWQSEVEMDPQQQTLSCLLRRCTAIGGSHPANAQLGSLIRLVVQWAFAV